MTPGLDSGRRSWAGSLLWLLLAGASVALALDGASLRDRAVALIERAGLSSAPGVVETALVIPAPGDAAAYAAESALARVGGSGPATPGVPAGPPPDPGKLLAETRSLALEALADSPGGPQQRVLVGRAAYAAWELQPDSSRRWEQALAVAAAGAPGFEVASDALGSAYLRAWPRLSDPERERARPAVAAAFRSPSFVRRELPGAMSRMGPEPAVRLLPKDRAALEAAASILAALGQSSLAEQAARAATEAPPTSPETP